MFEINFIVQNTPTKVFNVVVSVRNLSYLILEASNHDEIQQAKLSSTNRLIQSFHFE